MTEKLRLTRQGAKIQSDAQTRGEPVDSRKTEQLRACEQKYLPLVEWEKHPANPKAADFKRDLNAILKPRNHEGGDTIADGTEVAEAMEMTAACEREAAA
jgi:hypothetical protein